MSSAWTTISMSLLMVGCGGDIVRSIADRKADSVSARRPPDLIRPILAPKHIAELTVRNLPRGLDLYAPARFDNA